MKAVPRCKKCRAILPAPEPHPDGLPGLLYRTCPSCGQSHPVTSRPRREKLPEPNNIGTTKTDAGS